VTIIIDVILYCWYLQQHSALQQFNVTRINVTHQTVLNIFELQCL